MGDEKIKSLFSRGYNRPTIPLKQVEVDTQQNKCITTNSKNVIVVAGAGSGKTTVITERIKYLLNSGVKPKNIVAITFTNLAAEEMKERLRDVKGISGCFIGTIHSFANRIMRSSGEKYKLLTDDLELQYFKELTEKYCKALTYKKVKLYRKLQSQIKVGVKLDKDLKTFFTSREFSEYLILTRESDMYVSPKVVEKYPETISTLSKKDNAITFDELIKYADRYFRETNSHVEYLLVDEFQDIGLSEYSFIEGLNATCNFFVGDDYQSIYEFKGGNVTFFFNCMENPKFTTYLLTNNYRCSEEVVKFAQMVISQVTCKVEKEVNVLSDCKGRVEMYRSSQIVDLLHRLSQTTKDFGDWFILTRTNKELYKVADICKDFGIPYITFKREGLTLSDLRGKLNSNKVKILTVHTSKGLESKNVILYGNFPSLGVISDEEAKVLYVGVTRAKENLILVS